MAKTTKVTINGIIKDFFIKNPLRDISQKEVTTLVKKQYKKKTGREPQDPWRGVRQLHEQGFLIKVTKGIYKYDPNLVNERKPENFTEAQKNIILERDGHKCVVCGAGKKEGVELHIDHIKPKDKGGKATLENGQVLCSKHNFLKKNLQQTETGKKMFIKLYELAKIENNKELIAFSQDLLKVFEKHDVNGHIEWKK